MQPHYTSPQKRLQSRPNSLIDCRANIDSAMLMRHEPPERGSPLDYGPPVSSLPDILEAYVKAVIKRAALVRDKRHSRRLPGQLIR
jgi:hypothetical protein